MYRLSKIVYNQIALNDLLCIVFFYHAAESLDFLFVCLQSQYRFVCEAILKVYEEEIVKPFETEPPVEKEE